MAQNNVVESSVQSQGKGTWQNVVFRLAQNYDAIPDWWSPKRDSYFRKYWYQEPFLASAVYAIANRNAAFGFEFTGSQDDIKHAQQLVQFAGFGIGWHQFITKFSIDYITQDNGAFMEVIRPAKVKIDGKSLQAIKEFYEGDKPEWFAIDNGKRIALKNKNYVVQDSPLDLPIGIAHLDAGQCVRTGDSDVPVIYTDRYGKRHKLKWWQVLTFNEMPSPIEKMNGVGYSALTRVFRASHIMQSISIYNDEKVSGRFNRAVHLTNIDADTVNDAIRMAEEGADNRNLIRYSQPIIASTLNPDGNIALQTINLAEIPDNFDFNTLQNWYIANLALALGVDYGFLAPLPGKGLGTASQSEMMAKQTKGKSSRLFMDAVSNALNFKGVLPESVQFNFVERDPDAEKQEIDTQKSYADVLKTLIETGMVTPTIARQMAADKGIIAVPYIEMLGEQDETPIDTIEGDENVNAIQEQQEIIEEEKFYEQVKTQKAKLFKAITPFERIKNVARKAFKTKQIETLETENPQLNIALQRYAGELEPLVLQAQSGQITKAEFVRIMQDLVGVSLTAIYSEFSGLEPEEFTAQDEANLEEQLAINFDSINKLADDIYAERYEVTEDRDGILMLLGRMSLWTNIAAGLAWTATLHNPELQENKLLWSLGIAEHCDTCLALDGQIHTVSEWRESGFYPQDTEKLLCNGFNCQCSFSEVEPDTPSTGSFDDVPTK